MPTIASPLAQPPALDASTGSPEAAARPADAASAPVAAGAPKAVPTATPAAPAPNASAPSGPDRSIESGGVADWNWAYDPAKQL
jgi:hypothetical protein